MNQAKKKDPRDGLGRQREPNNITTEATLRGKGEEQKPASCHCDVPSSHALGAPSLHNSAHDLIQTAQDRPAPTLPSRTRVNITK